MKRFLARSQASALLVMMSLSLATHSARAATESDGSPALGIVLGDPTGITGKLWLNGNRAVDAGLAYSFSDYLLVYGDHLWHFPGILGRSSSFVRDLRPYVGIGANLFFSTRTNRGKANGIGDTDSGFVASLRFPVGAEWRPQGVPLGIFVEIVPGMGVIPSTFGELQGGIGARFYFDR